MNPTPERALELAEIVELWADAESDGLEAEIAAILRAYADLSRKWQAVLDAEPVGACEMEADGCFVIATDSGYKRPPVGVHRLIIKPTA